MSHTGIDLQIEDSPCTVAFAHYDANYIIDETVDVDNAWTGMPMMTTSYLYWDIDLATGALSRGFTTVTPVAFNSMVGTYGSPTEPPSPVHDLHWFDLTTKRMRVYRKPTLASTGVWQDKVRVFAGWIDSNAIIYMFDNGASQINVHGAFDAGNLIIGVNNAPLKQQNGTFATTSTSLIIQQTAGQNVKFDAALIFAKANEEISELRCVSFLPHKRIGLASSNNLTRFVSGISVEHLNQEDIGQVVTNGVIRDDQFMWDDAYINAPLFCGPTGQILLTPPANGVVQQIGWVYDNDAIFVHLFPPVRLS